MSEEKRKYLVFMLYNTLNWMCTSDDWFKRSLLVTRTIGIIHDLGMTKEAVIEMPVEWLVMNDGNLRKYREKLNQCIDVEDRDERTSMIIEFLMFLQDIHLLRNNE